MSVIRRGFLTLGFHALAAVLALGTVVVEAASADEKPFITVASTTSTEQSGLFGHLLPEFTKKTGIAVRVVAVGTGQALKLGEHGDADVELVHDTPSELAFVAAGFGVGRREVMYNDFVLIGPMSDPAKVGPTLNTAVAMAAYTLADRGTWLSFQNRRDLAIAVAGDKRLFNQYGVMLVNPAKYPSVKQALGQHFIDWLTSPEGQQTIADYKINGEQLFFPNYRKPGA